MQVRRVLYPRITRIMMKEKEESPVASVVRCKSLICGFAIRCNPLFVRCFPRLLPFSHKDDPPSFQILRTNKAMLTNIINYVKMCKRSPKVLLMACERRHFESRQRPQAPECRRHLNTAVWPEVCRARTKYVNTYEQRIIPEHNANILLKLYFRWFKCEMSITTTRY